MCVERTTYEQNAADGVVGVGPRVVAGKSGMRRLGGCNAHCIETAHIVVNQHKSQWISTHRSESAHIAVKQHTLHWISTHRSESANIAGKQHTSQWISTLRSYQYTSHLSAHIAVINKQCSESAHVAVISTHRSESAHIVVNQHTLQWISIAMFLAVVMTENLIVFFYIFFLFSDASWYFLLLHIYY